MSKIELMPVHGNDYYVAFLVGQSKSPVGEVVRKYGRFVVRHNSGNYAEFDRLEDCRRHLAAVCALED